MTSVLSFLRTRGLGLMFELYPPLNLTPTAASGKKPNRWHLPAGSERDHLLL